MPAIGNHREGVSLGIGGCRMRRSGCVKVIILLPFILLVRIIAKYDPHLFRYWAVDSMEYWRRWGASWTWKAYAMGVAGWAILFGAVYFLARLLN